MPGAVGAVSSVRGVGIFGAGGAEEWVVKAWQALGRRCEGERERERERERSLLTGGHTLERPRWDGGGPESGSDGGSSCLKCR